ncbi:MAG TPA: SRPBCC family protein [Chitinophagaceae bacterium]|nr:SRPBCC family protein [Chitinophagaceae bacterium]
MKAINQQAPVQCTQSILINASAATVWQWLTGINEWSQWQQQIPVAKAAGKVAAGTPFHWKTGGATIRSTVHTAQPFTSFGWTGNTMGLYAIHNWTLQEQVDGSTLVRVEESMEGWLARLFKKSFNKNLATGMAFWLAALKTVAEKR